MDSVLLGLGLVPGEGPGEGHVSPGITGHDTTCTRRSPFVVHCMDWKLLPYYFPSRHRQMKEIDVVEKKQGFFSSVGINC